MDVVEAKRVRHFNSAVYSSSRDCLATLVGTTTVSSECFGTRATGFAGRINISTGDWTTSTGTNVDGTGDTTGIGTTSVVGSIITGFSDFDSSVVTGGSSDYKEDCFRGDSSRSTGTVQSV